MSSQQEYSYTMRPVRRPFSEKFPTILGIIIAILQMLLNGAIVGLEGGSIAYNPTIDTIYAGFWCSVSFFFTWTSMFAFLCFRKTFRWGLVVAGINFASIGFGVIIIIFDCLFIQYPCQCYLATICNLQNSINVNNCVGSDGKLIVIKIQLACTAAMVALNIIYIIVCIVLVALSRTSHKPMSPSYQTVPSPQNSSPKPLTSLPRQTLAYSVPNQSSYNPRYRQSGYPDQTSYWGPSTPFSNRLEKY